MQYQDFYFGMISIQNFKIIDYAYNIDIISYNKA